MAHDKLIAFLEEEAKILRNRIAGLSRRDMLSGVRNEDSDPTDVEAMEAENKRRLAEVEDHLKTLKADNRSAA